MRALHLAFAALAFSVLAGCSGKSGALAPLTTTPAEAEAYVAKLSSQPIKGKATAAADIASVRDALPKDVAVTWDKLDFDAAAGATVLTNVKITPAQSPTVGVSIAELRLWDFDAAFAKARLTGQRLTETASLARRIEAKNISLFGLETLMGQAAQAGAAAAGTVTGAVTAPLTANNPELAAQLQASEDVKLDNYQVSFGSLLVDDIMLRPYEIKPVQLAQDNPFASMMPFLQGYVAGVRTIAYDSMAAKDVVFKLAMSEAGKPISVNLTAETFGGRGVRGGDNDVAFLRNLKFDVTAPNPETPATPTMTISGGIDLYTFEGMRFDKLYGYLAKGEWPPRTEANLLSLGLFQMKGERFAVNGKDFFSVGDSTLDARNWYWFVPTKLRASANDVVYDIDAIMTLAGETATGVPSSTDTAGAPARPAIDPRIMEALAKYGLNKPSIDYSLGWDWNPTSGAATIDGALGLDNYIRFDAKFEGGLPTFKAVSDLVPDDIEKTNGDAIGKVFETASNLKSAEINISEDKGGLDKLFGVVVDIGKLMPVEPGAPDIFANQSPQSLRQAAVGGIYMIADQAEAQVPGAKALLAPFAAFVEKGGKVHVTFKPKKPIDSRAVEAMGTGTAAPTELLKDMKVEHTPPK